MFFHNKNMYYPDDIGGDSVYKKKGGIQWVSEFYLAIEALIIYTAWVNI